MYVLESHFANLPPFTQQQKAEAEVCIFHMLHGLKTTRACVMTMLKCGVLNGHVL